MDGAARSSKRRQRVARLLAAWPRRLLAHQPTPLEPADRLSRALGGPRLWIKRDDCTGLAGGGNKARKLEFLLGLALEERADILVTAGAVQSNHARQVAAAAQRVGMDCLLLLTESVPGRGEAYGTNGNLLLDRVLDAEVRLHPAATETGPVLDEAARDLRTGGRRPFIIPVGGSDAIGTLGYIAALAELLGQCAATGIDPTAIVVPTGSGGTQAGLLLGAALMGWPGRIVGVSVGASEARQRERVCGVIRTTADTLAVEMPAARAVHVDDRFVAGGYGLPDDATCDAIRLFARTEGLLLDPVYTGKAAAGLIRLTREGALPKGDVVFLHTGGAPALAAYPELFPNEGRHR